MKTYKQTSGLTLVELMVTVAAASVVVLTIILVLMAAFRSWRINNSFVDMRRNAAFATALIVQDIRESTFTNVLSAAENQLVLAANPPVRNTQVSYTKVSDSSLNSSSFGILIPRGVQRFAAEVNTQGDGVYVTLVLTNQYHIGITNRFFANTRN
jgi:Tfp pilus assembly protein PilW